MIGAPIFRYALTPGWAGDRLTRAAQAVPSLDLNFAVTKNVGPLVSFTRASSATYIDSAGTLQTAAVDVPRFDHNPTTGESLGLLVEEQRTNLLLRSEEFDNASWVLVSLAVTANQIASPSGSTSADLIAGSAGTANKYLYQIYTASTSGTFTFSVFAKAGTESFIVVRAVDQTGANEVRQRFDLSSGTLNGSVAVGGTATSGSASIAAFGNGWYRCSVTATFAAFTQLQGNVWLNVYGSTSLTTNYYAWGAQLEAGAFPTSYIPTTTAAATRNADVASITGSAFSSWYRQDEGAVFAFSSSYGATNSSRRIAFATDGTTANRFGLLYNNSNNPQIVVASAGTINAVPSVALTGATYAIAAAYKLDDYAISAAGSAPSTDTSGALPVSINQLSIGSQLNTEPLNGTIRRLTYWPQRLPNSTLQAITQ
jgi:hypothetical protein